MSGEVRVETVSSRSEFQDVVKSLGETSEGVIRVYRGQTKAYIKEETGLASLLPALARQQTRQESDPLWLSKVLVTLATQAAIPAELIVHQLWSPALIQHYGPGSSFLDVTSNINTGLWFAFHNRSERWISLLLSPDTKRFAPHSFCTCWYTRLPSMKKGEPLPVLFVFDLKPWDGKETIKHGQLVSLQSSPWGNQILKSATRLQAQDAHLIYADAEDPKGPDLNRFLKATIYLRDDESWREPDAPHNVPAFRVFSSPKDDGFYRLLLDIPGRVCFQPLHLEHPLAIPCYLVNQPPLWEDPEIIVKQGSGARDSPAIIGFRASPPTSPGSLSELMDYVELSSQLDPILMYPFLLENPSSVGQAVQLLGASYELDKVVPFFVESPLWDITPPVADFGQPGMWIESGLVCGIPDTVADRPADSFYVEVSNLESSTLGSLTNQDHLRGVWIIRRHPLYCVTLYFISGGTPAAVTHRFKYDAREGRFEWLDTRSDAAKAKHPLTKEGIEIIRKRSLKALFVGLTLLRDLSPTLKPPPYHAVHIDDNFFSPSVFLETQCADVIQEPPFLIPKSLRGAAYVHTSGFPDVNPKGPEDVNAWVKALLPYLKVIRDPFYLMPAGRSLAEIYHAADQPDLALQYIDWSLSIAAIVKSPVMEAQLLEVKARMKQNL